MLRYHILCWVVYTGYQIPTCWRHPKRCDQCSSAGEQSHGSYGWQRALYYYNEYSKPRNASLLLLPARELVLCITFIYTYIHIYTPKLTSQRRRSSLQMAYAKLKCSHVSVSTQATNHSDCFIRQETLVSKLLSGVHICNVDLHKWNSHA